MSITTLVKTIQDIMRKDVGVDGDAQRISQMVWLIFLKIFDDKEAEWMETISKYESPIPQPYRWSSWAKNDEGMTGDALIKFVNNDLFPELKKLATHAGVSELGRVVGFIFEDGYNYMKSGNLLREVINTIEKDIDFNSSEDRHLFNDIYEKILKDLQSAGNAGEYYTPRALTQFIVDRVNPQLGEKVLDPACGTGGFLTCTIEHLKEQVGNRTQKRILQESIFGIEKKPLPHMLAVTNMILHGIEIPKNIRRDNSLSKPLREYGPKDRVNCIVTNPPFGGMEEDGIEKNFPKVLQTKETADLFLLLIIKLLKPGGRAGIILPDGSLFGEGVKTKIKEILLEECNLHTIVRLPNGVFNPYTGIRTNLLFFEKGEPTNEVWYYELNYPEGVKNYNKTRPIDISEFDVVKEWWGKDTNASRKKRKENEFAWKVSIKEIRERNYNLDSKNPHLLYEDHEDPEEILKKYISNEKIIREYKEHLKNELQKSKIAYSKFLIEQFDIIISIPHGIKKIREKILQLAVQGKLEKQNSDDEPASELLKKIRAEKEKLASEGKIKKPSTYAIIKEEEKLFDLPKGWDWGRIGDLFELRTGATPSTSNKSFFGGKIKWLVSGDIHKGEIFDCDGRITEEGMMNSNCKILPKNSVLIALNGQGKTRATVAILRTEATCNQSLVAMIPIGNYIIPEYLYLNLKGRYYQIRDITGQKQRRGLNMGLVGSLVISIPPLLEQHRIVEKVKELMNLCDKLEEKLAHRTQEQERFVNSIVNKIV